MRGMARSPMPLVLLSPCALAQPRIFRRKGIVAVRVLARDRSRHQEMLHDRADRAAFHSSRVAAFRARKLMPTVPNFAALPACGAPLKTSARQVISKSTKPAATTVARSSASSRAPAIQPFQRSTFRVALSGTGFSTRMSPI
jgi:hypothetical protein